MHSHHSHSSLFCSHAHPGSAPSSMVSTASALGFTTYCLSEHVPRQYDEELYPEEVEEGTNPEGLLRKWREYLVEAKRVQGEWNGKGGKEKGKKSMQVIVGAETENLSPETLDWLIGNAFSTGAGSQSGRKASGAAAVGKGKVDYLVGSVHHACSILPDTLTSRYRDLMPAKSGIPIDFDAATFDRAVEHMRLAGDQSEEEALLRVALSYFEAQWQVLERLRPEVVGHFDLVRLFRPTAKLFWSEPELADTTASTSPELRYLRSCVTASVERNIRLAISYGALFEINSASLRKGWPTPYPQRDILDRILSLGGRLCLSDDAHGPTHVAISYAKSREYLISVGIKSLWHLELSPEDVEGRHTKEEEEEVSQRIKRAEGHMPGEGAPVVFERGCRAVEGTAWADDVFWGELQGRRADFSH